MKLISKARSLWAFALFSAATLPATAFGQALASATVTDATGTIRNQATAIGSIGVAVLAVIFLVRAFSWMRKS